MARTRNAASDSMDGSHGFSPRQMNSLVALLDTLIPSISYIKNESEQEEEEEQLQATKAFYELSASQAGTPTHAASLMFRWMRSTDLCVIGVLLWLLSSRLGTLLLLGVGSLGKRGSKQWKGLWLRSFSEISQAEREKLLLHAWSHSPHVVFRSFFDVFRIFGVFSHFTKADKGKNLTWKAIGYCGPDPLFLEHLQNAQGVERTSKPLDGVVIDAEVLGMEEVLSKLKERGFHVLEDLSHLTTLMGNMEQKKLGGRYFGVRCDAVVLGSGCGGGVVAGVLAKAGYKVLVVEKGRYFTREDLSLLEGPSMEKMYENGGILATRSGNVRFMAGSLVGGGSSVNWGASFRTPDHLLQDWSGKEHGLGSLFASARYQKAMDAVMTRLSVCLDLQKENLQNGVLRDGCRKLDFTVSTVPRNCGSDDHWCGWCGFGCWSGQKQATPETWLVDAGATGGAVLSGAMAQVVLLQNSSKGRPREAAGVVVMAGHQSQYKIFVEAKITVVACGALHSPPLLRLSGLRNPNIGKHLHVHPVWMVWGYFPSRRDGLSYEGSIMTSVSTEVANWRAGGYGCILECPSMHPGVFAAVVPWLSSRNFKDRMLQFPRTVNILALTRDRGEGSVSYKPGTTQLAIDYELDPYDRERLIEGGEAALRVLIAAGAAEVGTHHRLDDHLKLTSSTSDADIRDFLERVRSHGIDRMGAPLGSAHQMGSCRMGADPKASVVDVHGETWEVGNLFVADASVLPTAAGINPMVTIQSVAYCIAHSVINKLQCM